MMLKIKLRKKEWLRVTFGNDHYTVSQIRHHLYEWCDTCVKGASRYNSSYGFTKLLFFHIENHGTNPAVIDKNTIQNV